MAVDAFIWFAPAMDGMLAPKGETKDSKYSKTSPNPAFEIKDFSFGIENPTTIGSATGGAGSGKVKFNEFTVKKTSDGASCAFFQNCCAGAHYSSVTIEMRKSGGDPNSSGKAFLRFTFGTVFTTKIDWSGPGDEGPEETITFVYGQLGVAYWPQKSDGGQDAQSTPGGWDQVLNIDASAFGGSPANSVG